MSQIIDWVRAFRLRRGRNPRIELKDYWQDLAAASQTWLGDEAIQARFEPNPPWVRPRSQPILATADPCVIEREAFMSRFLGDGDVHPVDEAARDERLQRRLDQWRAELRKRDAALAKLVGSAEALAEPELPEEEGDRECIRAEKKLKTLAEQSPTWWGEATAGDVMLPPDAKAEGD